MTEKRDANSDSPQDDGAPECVAPPADQAPLHRRTPEPPPLLRTSDVRAPPPRTPRFRRAARSRVRPRLTMHFEVPPPGSRFLAAAAMLMAAHLCSCAGECRGDGDCPNQQTCLPAADASAHTCCPAANQCDGVCCSADSSCIDGQCAGAPDSAPTSGNGDDTGDCGWDCGGVDPGVGGDTGSDDGTSGGTDEGSSGGDTSGEGSGGDDSSGGTT